MRQLAWELVTQSAASEQQAFTLSRNPTVFCKHRTQLWELPGPFALVPDAAPHAVLNDDEPNVTKRGGRPSLCISELKL